tara:strand:+ start:319 stop:681 length:363 start_codon:yes stop_codon:yes gene_type:complete
MEYLPNGSVVVTRLGEPVTLNPTEHFYERLDVRIDGILNNLRTLKELTEDHAKFGKGTKESKAHYVSIIKSVQKKLQSHLSYVVKEHGKDSSAKVKRTAKGKVKKTFVKKSVKDILKKHK